MSRVPGAEEVTMDDEVAAVGFSAFWGCLLGLVSAVVLAGLCLIPFVGIVRLTKWVWGW